MTIGDYLIWKGTNGLLLIPVVLGPVMVVRRCGGRPVFTESDWRFLFGHPREKVFTARLWIRFAALWLAVIVIGLMISFYVLPYGVGWFAGAALLAIAGILLIVPKWLR
jgi:hypothetical protein